MMPPAGPKRTEPPLISPDWLRELHALRDRYDEVYRVRNLVGRMPPSPGTFRARASAGLIQVIRRMLFWYTPQIARFQEAVTGALDLLCTIQERQFRFLARLQEEWPQDRTRLGERLLFVEESQVRAWRLRDAEWLAQMAPVLPSGLWIDLQCGRGEWQQAWRGRQTIQGVDPRDGAVERGRAEGFRVEQQEPLAYLREQAAASAAVVTAWGVLEELPLPTAVQWLREASRVLAVGGVFLADGSLEFVTECAPLLPAEGWIPLPSPPQEPALLVGRKGS